MVPDDAELGAAVQRDEHQVAGPGRFLVGRIVEGTGERIRKQHRDAWTRRLGLLYGRRNGGGGSMTRGAGSGRNAARGIDEAEIVRFLQLQPDFLARHPSLYLTLAPPARVHGEQVADHMAAMILAARRQNQQLQEGVRRRRAGQSLGERVEQALLGLIRSADPLEWVRHELGGHVGHRCGASVPRRTFRWVWGG